MISNIIEWLGSIAHSLIEAGGYLGLFFGMLLESLNIPLPSEALMTFAGALVADGEFAFWGVVIVGTLGNLAGSIINYYIGMYGGRPFVERYGKYFLVHHSDLDVADRWFAKYGLAAVFFARMMPIVRTFISLPAGISRVPIVPFSIATFFGCLLWSILLTWVGYEFGKNYEEVFKPLMQKFEILIALVIVIGVVWYVRRHIKLVRKHGS